MDNKSDFSISFEFFPPKTDEGVKNLFQTANELTEVDPTFCSVTFGAGGSTISGTVETVKNLQQRTATNIVPHLSCIGATREELIDMLNVYKKMNITRLIALRGDLPSGMVQAGDFLYASDLVTLIREVTGNHFYIDVAAYPEIHPQAKSPMEDVLNLKRKFDAGANSAITQYFFNADAYCYLRDECARYGLNKPMVPGIMPITQFTKLARFSDSCGAEIPLWLRKRFESYGDDADSIKSFGVEVVYALCERLIREGAPGLHFYTLNKADATIKLLNMLSLSKKRNNAAVYSEEV